MVNGDGGKVPSYDWDAMYYIVARWLVITYANGKRL